MAHQSEDFYSKELDTTFCLIDDELYELNDEDEFEPVDWEIVEEDASMVTLYKAVVEEIKSKE